MMELPEIERMIEVFAGYATGKTISSVIIDDPSIDVDPELARAQVEGHAIEAVERHGKFVVLRFRSEHSLVFHLGSEGEIYLESQTALPSETSRVRLQFAAGRELRYSAPPSGGEVHLVKSDDFRGLGTLENLGIDPLSEELTPEIFRKLAAAHPRSSLKGLLMNQQVVAAIGNQYADEICFQAGYRPDLKVGDMTPHQLDRIHRYLKRVLRRATLHWQTAHADPGWLINHRAPGEPCPRCKGRLEAMNLVGRKTYICPRCQRAA